MTMGMHEETSRMLEKGPHPLPWTLGILLTGIVAVATRSVILGMIAGLLMGLYTGHYQGRILVLRAWRRDLELDGTEASEARGINES